MIWILFHITRVFLASNNKIISKIQKVQNKKLDNLCSNNSYFESVTSHDPDKNLLNFASYQLFEHEKSLLSKGLNFAVSPKNFNYADYMLPEVLFRDIDLLDIPRTDRDFIQGRLRYCAFTSYRDAAKNADKSIDQNKVLNHIVNIENRITSASKKFKDKNQISNKKNKDLNPVGSRPGILYGRAKIHKLIKDGVPPFRPILSHIGTPTYKIAKFFVPFLAPLTSNEYTIKDSFSFSEELLTFDSCLVMASFDIEYLFTNIPLKETINFCVDILFSNTKNVDSITKIIFMSF